MIHILSENPARDLEIIRKRKEGITVTALAAEYSLTQRRVSEICNNSRFVDTEKEDLYTVVMSLPLRKSLAASLYRALMLGGITNLTQLKEKSSEELIGLKGMGVRYIDVLAASGLIKSEME